MEKTEGKKTVIVIDEQGNKLESTYPKRAKGLIKNGRARYVDENTICLACLPKDKILEEKQMNMNKKELDLAYIMTKIDEIIEMNRFALSNPNLAGMSSVPGAKNPIQSICETNNKMIDLLESICEKLIPTYKDKNQDFAVKKMTELMEKAIENNDIATLGVLTASISSITKDEEDNIIE